MLIKIPSKQLHMVDFVAQYVLIIMYKGIFLKKIWIKMMIGN